MSRSFPMKKFLVSLAMIAAFAGTAAADEARAAFFGLVFIDTSLSASQEEEERRLAMVEARLLEALSENGYDFVDIAPVAERVDRYANIAQCNGCDTTLAAELGADVAVTGEVHKVSNLILSISIYLRDAETKQLVNGGSTDIRGNTDETWMRGVNWLLKNRLLKETP